LYRKTVDNWFCLNKNNNNNNNKYCRPSTSCSPRGRRRRRRRRQQVVIAPSAFVVVIVVRARPRIFNPLPEVFRTAFSVLPFEFFSTMFTFAGIVRIINVADLPVCDRNAKRLCFMPSHKNSADPSRSIVQPTTIVLSANGRTLFVQLQLFFFSSACRPILVLLPSLDPSASLYCAAKPFIFLDKRRNVWLLTSTVFV